MKKILVIILIVLFALSTGAWVYFWYLGSSANNQAGTVPIEEIFDDKVVYTSDQDADTESLKQDCDERGGRFNTCGTICSSEDIICANVCAYTCELGENGNIGQEPSGESGEWVSYQNGKMGFSLRYPEYLEFNENDNQINLSYWGPTQSTGTELYDGISLTVRGHELASGTNIQNFISEDLDEASLLGEVIATVSTSTLGSQTVYRYTVRTLGIMNKIIVPMDRENNEFLEIVYSIPDPQNQGYGAIIEQILESFVFEQILTTRHYIFPK